MSWSGGDWMCGVCEHINFKKRKACESCGYPKYGGTDSSTYRYNKTEALAGDWFCNCGAHNYASRSSCYRCGLIKDYFSSGYGTKSGEYGSYTFPPGWKNGDWLCPRIGCGVHNYASRTECFKCKVPRENEKKFQKTWNINHFPQHLSSPNNILSCFLYVRLLESDKKDIIASNRYNIVIALLFHLEGIRKLLFIIARCSDKKLMKPVYLAFNIHY